MKKSTLFLLGTLIIGMAFGLVLAGCDTGDDGLTAEELAEQLAADLDQISAGSATVDGSTVTLAGKFVEVRTNLTVPEGVTLDVTADGAALGLRDGTLTVNGTVISGPTRVRLEDNASEGTINGSGTIQLKGKGYLLAVEGNKNVSNRKLTLDGVTLAGVADNDNSLINVRSGGDSGSGRSGHLVMKSGKIMGNSNIGNSGAGGGSVKVNEGGTFTMEGGTISGNTAKSPNGGANGGGVRVGEGGTFIMQGGTISGNTAKGSNWSAGGGVSNDGGTFSMEGGAISGNTLISDDDQANGGGVFNNGTFIMEGGTISGNTAKGSNWSAGGGVRMEGGTFTMQGGAIFGNTAESGEWAGGGGVAAWNGTFSIEGGTIYGNTAKGDSDSHGGGVRIGSGTFTLKGGTIYGSADSLPAGMDAGLANSAKDNAALFVEFNTTAASWGMGGTYMKGGVSQTGGSNIVSFGNNQSGGTSDTLIAIPAN
jgi:hypothetical protein